MQDPKALQYVCGQIGKFRRTGMTNVYNQVMRQSARLEGLTLGLVVNSIVGFLLLE